MKMMSRTKTGLDLLQEVLDAYGGDRTRWPAHVRLELSQLLSVSPQARELLAGAQALDRLLDMAPAVPKEKIDALALDSYVSTTGTARIPTAPPAQDLSLIHI